MSRSLCALSLALLTTFGLSSCAPPLKPDGADTARRDLISLKADPLLAPQVPMALIDAELAVQLAEVPTRDVVAGQHAAHVAIRKVEIARTDAQRKVAEENLKVLNQQREAILREAQSRELEIASAQAEAAAAAAIVQQRAAQAAAEQAAAERVLTEELRRQLALLQAQPTPRGMAMTLGDSLFAVGKSDLQDGATARLDQLASFMHRYTDRTLVIEGHTDAQGSDEKNLRLSQMRAEAVKVYLIIQSVDSSRITTIGRGSEAPVTDSITPEGRMQNRRVEIYISEPLQAQ